MQHQETGNVDQLFLKGIGEGVLVQDSEGQVIGADAKAAEWLDTTIETLHDKNSLYQLWKTLGDNERSIPFEDLPPMKALRTGKTQRNVTMEIKTAENRFKSFVWNARPLFTSQQSVPFAVVSSFTDIRAAVRLSQEKTAESMVRVIGLIPSIEQLLNEIRHTGRFRVKFSSTIDAITERSMPIEKKVALFRIVQEEMINIVRHSHAANIRVNIMHKHSGIILYTYDDGVGFDLRQVKKGRGLTSIYAGVRSFHGLVDILTAPNKGCSVTVLMPFMTEDNT
jgi:hypothetical protein